MADVRGQHGRPREIVPVAYGSARVWNAPPRRREALEALERVAQEAANNLADEGMEYTYVQCGAVFRPSDGKIVCPSCGLEYRP